MPLASFLDVAATSHFPLENLPYGIFQPREGYPRVGTRVGDSVIDLGALVASAAFEPLAAALGAATAQLVRDSLTQQALNGFMALGRPIWQAVRSWLQTLLAADNATLRDDADLRARVCHAADSITMLLPCAIGDYTDFYSSRDHATNVGSMFRDPNNALLPNWLHLPVAYHGRASSVIVSGVDVHRPYGQTIPDGGPPPVFGPSKQMDFELEVGVLIGPGNPLGHPVAVTHAWQHIFGLVLVNDWSARDIQRWEYQPLGPFLAKNLATSISPWVVTLEALEPFIVQGTPQDDPAPLAYLRGKSNRTYDIQLEVHLQSAQMTTPMTIARTNYRHMYWNMCQQLAHHTVSGCNLRPGDLLASGTISGPTPDSYGSLLELTWRGTRPLTLPTGEARKFLQDGDRVTLTGWSEGDGYRIGFGEVSTRLLPALEEQTILTGR